MTLYIYCKVSLHAENPVIIFTLFNVFSLITGITFNTNVCLVTNDKHFTQHF